MTCRRVHDDVTHCSIIIYSIGTVRCARGDNKRALPISLAFQLIRSVERSAKRVNNIITSLLFSFRRITK